ncbi:MAG: recombinase family protein [Sphingobacteriales bacterium JAD_PAG50586_3]|nr:MAG: recombinase family protein [Sphingobacteriales bacterium JAD_PAG50586_3]
MMNHNKNTPKSGLINNLDRFKRFIENEPANVDSKGTIYGVIYTRVSSKDQFDKNGSLETQLKMCNNLAQNYHVEVLEAFGGTYESAKTEERKEFQRMMKFINSSKKPSDTY